MPPPDRAAAAGLLLAAALIAATGEARAQVAGAVAVTSADRYRGVATVERGAVLRLSVLADSTAAPLDGLYGGISGLLRLRDGGFASADALVGWSGRLSSWPGLGRLDPRWGWDAAVHRQHYGESGRYDFGEAMVGLLAPGWSARFWWAPHYFGGTQTSLYLEADASQPVAGAWRVFAHVGRLEYGAADPGAARIPGRTDGRLGAAWSGGDWEISLAREGLLQGHPASEAARSRAGAAWVASVSRAF